MDPLLLARRRAPMLPLIVLLTGTLLFQVTLTVGQSIRPNSLSSEQITEIEKLSEEVFGPPPNQNIDNNNESNNNGMENPDDQNLNSHLSTDTPSTNSDGCICVAYYLCINNTIVEDGSGVIDIRINANDPCKHSFEKCCNLKDVTTATTVAPKVSNDESAIPKCGQRNRDGVGFRITGYANDAQLGEFPWMVALLKKDPVKNVLFCGGSLIHPKVVLTAIHCVNSKKNDEIIVRAGEYDTETENEFFKHQDRSVLKIIKHDKFYAAAVFNDVALIVLEKPFILMETVGTVCLPPQGYIYNTERCFASGWGKDSFGKNGVEQHILKKIDMPIVQHDKCLDLLRKTRLGSNYHLHESFLCAGGELGKDTCQGDGGSPMACPINGKSNQYHQAGIVAWGIGCGDETPGVYVNVARFRLWIDHQMLHLQANPLYYDANYDPANQNANDH